jgi:transposase
MEACGSAHPWARVLGSLGHQVGLLPPRQVKAFVRSNKSDAADARAIWLAAQQSDIRRAPVKSCEQQAVLALHRTRSHWVSVRTATINALRGLLYEFGVVLRGGRKAGLKMLAQQRTEIDEQLPMIMRGLVDGQLMMLSQLEQRIDALEHEITALEKQLNKAKVLREMTGIGVLSATALAATLGDGKVWRFGREFAACLGLVPAHKGTGGKTRVGHLSKRGDPYLPYPADPRRAGCHRACQAQVPMAGADVGAPAVQRGDGGSGQQDGSHGVGPGGSLNRTGNLGGSLV